MKKRDIVFLAPWVIGVLILSFVVCAFALVASLFKEQVPFSLARLAEQSGLVLSEECKSHYNQVMLTHDLDSGHVFGRLTSTHIERLESAMACSEILRCEDHDVLDLASIISSQQTFQCYLGDSTLYLAGDEGMLLISNRKSALGRI